MVKNVRRSASNPVFKYNKSLSIRELRIYSVVEMSKDKDIRPVRIVKGKLVSGLLFRDESVESVRLPVDT